MKLRRFISFLLMVMMLVSLCKLTYADNGENQVLTYTDPNYSRDAKDDQEESKVYFETEMDKSCSSVMKIKEHIDISNECFDGYETIDDTELTFEKIMYESAKKSIVEGFEKLLTD